jgi:hypothetical protein
MGDSHGQLTTRLNAAAQPLKDNRLLPVGFSKLHTTYDTVAIWGNANFDPDYNANSQQGIDHIEYRIPLDGTKGFGRLSASLHYQALPSRWMQDLFEDDTISQVAQFQSMYQNYSSFDEVIDDHEMIDIDLSGSFVNQVEPTLKFSLTPNPATGRILYLGFDSDAAINTYSYQLSTITE